MSEIPPQPPHVDPYAQTQPAPAPYPAQAPSGDPPGLMPAPAAVEMSQSAMGKLSIFLGVFGVLALLATIVIAGIMAGHHPSAAVTDEIASFGVMAGVSLNCIGFVLALLGFVEKDKKRATAWAGLVINGVPCVCGGGVFFITVLAILGV